MPRKGFPNAALFYAFTVKAYFLSCPKTAKGELA